MVKNKNGRNLGPKGHARPMKKGQKLKKKSKKYQKKLSNSLRVQCRLRFAFPRAVYKLEPAKVTPANEIEKMLSTKTQKLLLWWAWNCNSRLQSLKEPHGPIFIKIWEMRASGPHLNMGEKSVWTAGRGDALWTLISLERDDQFTNGHRNTMPPSNQSCIWPVPIPAGACYGTWHVP